MLRVRNLAPNLGRMLGQVAKQDVEFATRVTVTRMAKHVQAAWQAEINAKFDRPVPLTQRAVFQRRVDNPQGYTMHVMLKDDIGRNSNAPAKYLQPHVYGGPRREKASEKALRTFGMLPSGAYTVPGIGAKLDQYGNIPGGRSTQLLSFLGAAEAKAGATRNKSSAAIAKAARATKRRDGVAYFVSKGPGKGRGGGPRSGKFRPQHLPAGVYMRNTTFGAAGNRITPVLLFTSRRPMYKPRLALFAVADRTLRTHWQPEFQRALREALRSSRSVSIARGWP